MKKIFILSLFLLGLSLSGCGTKETATQSEPSVPQAETPAPQQPEEPVIPTFKYTAPLTGLGTNEELPKRVVMVMINNAPQARPQSGLDKADILYEILAEGAVTRFVGIYHSQMPEIIGPVRSIRPYYIDIGSGFDAIMVHAGGSPDALHTLNSKGMAHMDEIYNAGSSFWRESFRKAPHNLYTDIDKIWKGAASLGFRMEAEIPQLTFAGKSQEAGGTPAKKINVRYTSQYEISYEYDEDLKRYKRLTLGKPHMDLTTGQQLSTVNLLVLASSHKILDKEGRRDVDVFGPGKGYLFQRGKAQEITWERKGGLIRAYMDGKEIPMYPGNTWVNLIPNVPSLNQSVKFE